MNPRLSTRLIASAALAMPLVLHAKGAAPSADRRAFSAVAQRDAQGNRQTAMALSQPIGQHAWVQVGLGQTTVQGGTATPASRNRQAFVGGGWVGERWQAGVSAAYRRDGDRLRQQDFTASVDRRIGAQWQVGVDATRREARSTTTTVNSSGPGTTVSQHLRGRGLGVRVAYAATDRVTVYAAAQKSRYSGVTQASSAATPGGGLLGGLLTPAQQVTGVNRDEAALVQSQLLGTTVRVNDRVALTGEVAQDRLLDGSALRAAQLRAAIAVGDSGWTVAPGVGVSKGSTGGAVGSGSLRAAYVW